MGALNGPITYKLFYVRGNPPKDAVDFYLPQIVEHAFLPLTPDQEEDVSFGWVLMGAPFSTDFQKQNISYQNFINLSLREDRYVIPQPIVKAYCQREEQRKLAETGKGKLTKHERDDIKDVVLMQLREQVMPRMRSIDFSWDLTQGRVRFWTQSAKTIEMVMGLFYDTFNLELVPAAPGSTLKTMGCDLSSITEELSTFFDP